MAARQEKGLETLLVAYVVQRGKSQASGPERIRGFLKRSLPDYMIPAFFLRLEKLPLGANGKLDRRALPAPDLSCLQDAQDYVAPRNSTERVLTGLWEKLLKLDKIGIHQDFFELGGHSLTATRLVSHIGREFDCGDSVARYF